MDGLTGERERKKKIYGMCYSNLPTLTFEGANVFKCWKNMNLLAKGNYIQYYNAICQFFLLSVANVTKKELLNTIR